MTPRRAAALLVAVLALGGAVTPAGADEPEVTAETAVLWDPADDRVLWGRAPRRPMPPASTTKIMTVLLALEAGTLNDTVTVSSTAEAIGRRPGAATLNLRAGQQVAMRSLLAGLVLRSGNDAAVAVAEHVAGSEPAFVTRMNDRARELGMTDTNFVNATGLTNDLDHRASALDLARLAEVALRNRHFAEWAGAYNYTVPTIGAMVSRNELLARYRGATGVKTGYTNLAGLCLVASARRDGRELIAVVLNADDTALDQHFIDTIDVFDHGYTDFRRPLVAGRDERVTTYRWNAAAVDAVAATPLARTVATGADVTWRVRLIPVVSLPVQAGAELGTAELLVRDRVVDATQVVAERGVSGPRGTGAASAGGAVEDALRSFARLHVVDRDV